MTTTVRRWNEANTVEHPIIEWLVTPELGWRFEDQAAVASSYRTDEAEALLLPILREKLKALNPGVITDDVATWQNSIHPESMAREHGLAPFKKGFQPLAQIGRLRAGIEG